MREAIVNYIDSRLLSQDVYRGGNTGDFGGLPAVTVGDAAAVAKALRWMKEGVDFADGLHLAKAEGCEAFVTFDRDFAKAADQLDGTPARV